MNTNGVATCPVGKVTLRVNNNAAPGTYTISPAGSLAATGVSGGVTITIPTAECSHTWDSGKETTAATCTKEGEKALICAVCGDELKNEAIPAAGHDDGEWVVVTEATCKTDGLKELQCTSCGEMLDSEVIFAADIDHIPGEWVTIIESTCTEDGEKAQRCTVCDEELATEAIAAKGHDDGKWAIVKPATREETGLKELRCIRCDALLDTAVIPVKTTDYYVKNTVCSFGPSFRETSALTDNWYRFTPVDLSVDGVQIFDLIASDAYIIGQVTVTVTDGTVTIDYKYVSDEVKEHSAFCTFLPSLAETATLELSEMKNYGFGNPISIADDLGGDTKVLLFICNVIDYNTDIPITRMWPNTKDFTHKIDVLKENMD